MQTPTGVRSTCSIASALNRGIIFHDTQIKRFGSWMSLIKISFKTRRLHFIKRDVSCSQDPNLNSH